MGTSKERQGFFGKYTEHFDDDGKKIGESREREGFLGKYTEHTDAEGHKIGESREREGFLGKYTEHTDADGKKSGESREREGFLGKYTEHADADGKKTGESRNREGFLGHYVGHTGTGWRGTPQSQETSASSDASSYHPDYSGGGYSGTARVRSKSHWGIIVTVIGIVIVAIVYFSRTDSPPSEYYTGQHEEFEIQANQDFPLPPVMQSGIIYHIRADKPITISTLSGNYSPVELPAGTDYSGWRVNTEAPNDVIDLKAHSNHTHVEIFRYAVR